MELQSYQRRVFLQDTVRTGEATLYVTYSFGMLLPTVVLRGGGRRHLEAVPACRFCGPGHLDLKEWEMGLISQALGASVAGAVGAVAADAVWEKQFPTLHAFMTAIEEDGKPRTPSSLVVFTEEGVWKACLSEKDAGLQLWRTGESVQKLLGSLEKALASGSADWRRRYVPEGRGRAKKGK